LLDLYFKPHACCRWAQPAIDAIGRIRGRGPLDADAVRIVRVLTFEAATRLGPVLPATTEEAQYSLAWPIAAALVDGRVGPDQVFGPRLADPAIRALAQRIEAAVSPELERRFPDETLCEVELHMRDGTVLRSGICGARGDPVDPLAEDELRDKFRRLAEPVIGAGQADRVVRAVDALESTDVEDLLVSLRPPAPARAGTYEGT